MEGLIDLFLHLDTHLTEFVATYGRWVYALLFVIIFAETGLVVTPILPGDSLLFAAGALAATGALDIKLLLVLLVIAAVLGDAVNYAVGDAVGPRIFRSVDRTSWWQRMLNRDHLARARSSRSTAARRSSSAGSCRSSARSCRSSPAPAR